MSLINNMLKDLEKRKGKDQPPADIIPFQHLQPSTSQSKTSLIASTTVVILLLVGLTTWHHYKKPITKAPPTAPSLTQTAHPVNKLSPPQAEALPPLNPWLTSVDIKGITVQVKENITEVTFLLDHVALYTIHKNDLQNSFTIRFDHAALQAELPTFTLMQTAIMRVTEEKMNDNLALTFMLHPSASVAYVSLENENTRPELSIGFAYHAPLKPAGSDKNRVIKIPALSTLLSEQYQLALDFIKQGLYQDAIEKLSAIIESVPSYADARVSLAALLLDQGQRSKATKIVEEGRKLLPENTALVELSARILTLKGKYQAALSLLQTVSPTMSDNPDYHAFIAALYEKTNNHLIAAKIYKHLLTIDPHNGNWWFGLGMSLDKLNHPNEASTAYTQALAEGHLNPDSIAYLQKRIKRIEDGNHA